MIKAWTSMWKNTFNFTGTVTRKGYWLALIMNVIVMYAGAIPYALVAFNITDNVTAIVTIYIVIFHLPVLALYFRRARNTGWKTGTAVYNFVIIPILSGLIVGILSDRGTIRKGYSFIAKTIALSFGLFFYGGVLGLALYGDPVAIPILPVSGLLLCSFTLIGYGIVNWREVLAFFGGKNID